MVIVGLVVIGVVVMKFLSDHFNSLQRVQKKVKRRM